MRAAYLPLALLAVASACATEEAARREEVAGAGQAAEQRGERMCPKKMADVDVVAEDVPGGVAVNVTTSNPEQVAELREKVRAKVARHNGGGGEGTGGSGCPHHGHEGMKKMPPSKVTVEDIEGGARVVHVAEDPAQVDALRAQVREFVEHKREHKGKCPMKGEGEESR